MKSRIYSGEYNPRTMSSKKIIFIIPGFRQRTTSKAYKELSEVLKDEGYTPILVKITWRNSTISENTKHFLKVYKKNRARKKYILGFSYGAMIAFIAASQVNTSGLILCSLSPYFSEDVSKLKNLRFSAGRNKAISTLMENRYRDFSKLHYRTLAKLIKTRQVLMLYGRQETRSLISVFVRRLPK